MTVQASPSLIPAEAAKILDALGATWNVHRLYPNPADQPGPDDVVWRLPPTLATTREDPEGRAAMEAVGESNRMTLKFRKPD